ncbi:GNAT family N-acetyltransferase [Methylobacterium sp. A54F]
MAGHYEIRRATEADLPLLARWRAREHVRRWWGPPEVEPEAEKLAEPRVAMWIAERDDVPLAFIQGYRVADWSPHHFDDLPIGSRGLDLYIGEPAALGLGHGQRILRQHVDRLFTDGVPAVGIDPHPDNPRAIRSFLKAGFTVAGEPLDTRWGRAVPMHRHSGDVARSVATPPHHRRTARHPRPGRPA